MENEEKGGNSDKRCPQTRFARINKSGAVQPIYSFRNKLNETGECYLYGKKTGQLKKNKCCKQNKDNDE
jgi:hypothetical protein